MHSKYTLRQQLEAHANGTTLDERCHYFYDWFCKDASLKLKAKLLMAKAKKIVPLLNIDVDATYVIFKNNCPLTGQLYDDFRICDAETGDVIYTITPACGHKHTKGECDIWSRNNNFRETWKKAHSWKQMLQLLKSEKE